MPIIYRTDGAWGTGKGSNLLPAEVDGNFYDLSGRVTTLETNPPAPLSISNVTMDGDQVTFHRSDGATYGPFTLPSATTYAAAKEITATAHQLVAADAQKYLRCTAADGCTITIPAHVTVPFAIGTEIHLRQSAIGAVTIAAATGVTINAETGFLEKTAGLGAVITAKKVATDVWETFGRKAASA